VHIERKRQREKERERERERGDRTSATYPRITVEHKFAESGIREPTSGTRESALNDELSGESDLPRVATTIV